MPISNPISQASIMAEFGGGYPFVLGNYRRGAGIVPVSAGTAGIPSGYPISFQNFLGAYAPLSASRSPASIFTSRIGAGVITGSITVSASKGTGSYTYSTVWLSGGSGITITNPSTANPGVSSSASPTTTRTGTLRTTVSDGSTSVTLDTPVTLTWES